MSNLSWPTLYYLIINWYLSLVQIWNPRETIEIWQFITWPLNADNTASMAAKYSEGITFRWMKFCPVLLYYLYRKNWMWINRSWEFKKGNSLEKMLVFRSWWRQRRFFFWMSKSPKRKNFNGQNKKKIQLYF